MNNCVFVGNLTKDPQAKNDNGTTKVNFSIAINEYVGKQKQATFINCFVSGKRAETIVKYCRKGQTISVSGRVWASLFNNNANLNLQVRDFTFGGGGQPKNQNPSQYNTPVNNGQQYGGQGQYPQQNYQQQPVNYGQPQAQQPYQQPYQQQPVQQPVQNQPPVQNQQPVQNQVPAQSPPVKYQGEAVNGANNGSFFQ